MKIIFIVLSIAMELCSNQRRVIRTETDERGLTSVVFVEGKDTFALDYLTAKELREEFK